MIRLTIPCLDATDFAAVEEVLASTYLVQGTRVAAFEVEMARRVGVAHAVAVSNGTAALHLALLALAVCPGDLVVVTAYSWPATANAVELCGARPVFVDIEPDTYNLDPVKLADTLRGLMGNRATAPRVRAIMPVHAFGQSADMSAILECADRHGLPVIEDAACAIGARWMDRPAGAMGRLGCFSFHPRKAVTTGEGGMITTSDAGLARALRALRNHGLDPDAGAPDFIMPGFNYRLTEFQGALGLTQLAKLDDLINQRRSRAAVYDALLAGEAVKAPVVRAAAEAVYQSYVVQLPASAAPRRADIIASLKANGIETTIGTWHIPMTNFYRNRYGFGPGEFPATDQVFHSSLTLPLHHRLTLSEQRFVVEQLILAVNKEQPKRLAG